MTRTSTVKVICKSVEQCGAQYEQRVGIDGLGNDVRWSSALYDATLPTKCGVCGSGHIRVIDAAPRPVRV